jgi:hypothetical protein
MEGHAAHSVLKNDAGMSVLAPPDVNNSVDNALSAHGIYRNFL